MTVTQSNAISEEFNAILANVGMTQRVRSSAEYDFRSYALTASFRWALRD